MRPTRALACALLIAGCGDNLHLGGGQLVVSPVTGLHTNDRGNAATFTVAMSDPPVDPVTVTLTSSDLSIGVVTPAKLRFTRAGYGDPQPITITGIENHVATGPQSYVIHVAPDVDDVDPVDVDVTNDDSDTTGITVMPTVGLMTTQGGGQATFGVVLTSQPTADVTIPFATWSSSDTSVATISSVGVAAAKKKGTSTIGAAYKGVTGTTTLTVTDAVLVSIQVTPTNPSIANGTTQQFTATGLYSDGSTQDLTATATWASGTTMVATISTTGLASAKHVGMSLVSATSGGITGSTTLTVTDAVHIARPHAPT